MESDQLRSDTSLMSIPSSPADMVVDGGVQHVATSDDVVVSPIGTSASVGNG